MPITLRPITDSDLPIFFEQGLDEVANRMAAFTAKDPTDRAAFEAHWARIRADATVMLRTIMVEDQIAGYVGSYEQMGETEVTYWIGKGFWGKGIATTALALFLAEQRQRPLFARAAKDNVGSLRVLQKCGFQIIGEDSGFANARNAETEEYVLQLALRRGATSTY